MKSLSEKFPLSQKLYYLTGSRFPQCVYYQQLSIACPQVSFYVHIYFEYKFTNSVQGSISQTVRTSPIKNVQLVLHVS